MAPGNCKKASGCHLWNIGTGKIFSKVCDQRWREKLAITNTKRNKDTNKRKVECVLENLSSHSLWNKWWMKRSQIPPKYNIYWPKNSHLSTNMFLKFFIVHRVKNNGIWDSVLSQLRKIWHRISSYRNQPRSIAYLWATRIIISHTWTILPCRNFEGIYSILQFWYIASHKCVGLPFKCGPEIIRKGSCFSMH